MLDPTFYFLNLGSPTHFKRNPILKFNSSSLPQTIHLALITSPHGKGKRHNLSPLVSSTKSRIMTDENMHISMARMHIQTTPDDLTTPEPSPTMIAEESISIVRRRVIHIKRLARSMHHPSQHLPQITELLEDSPDCSISLKAEEAG